MFTVPKKSVGAALGHSADVSLWLHCMGRAIGLSQTGRSVLLLTEDVAVPSGPAKVEIVTDGVSHFSDVNILSRDADSLWVTIESL